MKPPPRNTMIGFRVSPETARRIRDAARADARSVSAFLSFLVERALTKESEGAGA